jgi:hypothetical protein
VGKFCYFPRSVRLVRLHELSSKHWRATRSLNWLKLHKFDPSKVVVIEIQLPFTVAAYFGRLRRLASVSQDRLISRLNTLNTQGQMIHDSARLRSRVVDI